MNDKNKIIILGASVFAEEVADIVMQIGAYEVVGFVEGINRDRCKERLLGLPIVWIEEVGKLQNGCLGLCAVGTTKRKHSYNKLSMRACRLPLQYIRQLRCQIHPHSERARL